MWWKKQSGGVGGEPRGRGRPRADGGGAGGRVERVTVYLTTDQINTAIQRGGGNLSLGLRRLLCDLAQE